MEGLPIIKRLFVSACEPSANIHLSSLAQKLDTSVHIRGIFEPDIFANFEDVQASYTLKDFAVMGFCDVLKKINFFQNAIDQMGKLAARCDVCLLMDSSSFNLPVARELKKLTNDVPIVYYILPQVWAWKQWRAKRVEQLCDFLCAILPFELEMYPNAVAESRAIYVGHPLLDEIPQLKPKALAIDEGKIAIMPGSRESEIRRIFPIFAKTAKQLSNPKVLVLPEHFKNTEPSELRRLYGPDIDKFELSFDANSALLESSFAFVCSGTATLQAALIGTPLVLGYKTRGTDVMLARAFVRLKHIGLANILYNAMYTRTSQTSVKNIHAEFIQADLTPLNLIRAFNETHPQVFFAKAKELRNYLAHGSRDKVTTLINRLLNR